MEEINDVKNISNLKENKILGEPNFVNSNIIFTGKNNILFCENNVNLLNTTITFGGNNSIVYLSSSNNNYSLYLSIYNDSTVYIGKNCSFGSSFNAVVHEHQNLIIGDDCIFSNGVKIRTSDSYSIYDFESKNRINPSRSIFIGDHVWVGHLAYVSRGTHIGSGAIIGTDSFISPRCKVPSNTYVLGNPAKIIKKGVFFTNEFVGRYTSDDSLNFSTYKSTVFLYENVIKETLSLNKIDEIINQLDVDNRLKFIKRLFVDNKSKNRFFVS